MSTSSPCATTTAARAADHARRDAGHDSAPGSRRTWLIGASALLVGVSGVRTASATTAGTGELARSGGPGAAKPAAHAWLPASRRIGQGTLRALGFAVYDAALFALPDFDAGNYEQHPLVLEILYRRAFAGSDIADYSLKEMRRHGDLDEATAQRWQQFMRRAFPDVRAGDRLTGQWLPDRATSRFAANDGPAIELVDATFGPRFFGIWLAARTPRPDMREQLLGLRRPT